MIRAKKINDKFEHIRSKQITRELEQKYGLHPAEKKQAADRPELKKVDYRAGDVKHQLSNTVKALASSYRFQSFTEYKALLSIYNVQAEEVKGEVNGKPYNGIVYSATNDKGEKQGNPFKSSSLGKSVGYEAIQRHIKKSTKDIQDKNLKERTRRTVGAVMKSAHSRKELEQELKKERYRRSFPAERYRQDIRCNIHRPRKPYRPERFTVGKGLFRQCVQRPVFRLPYFVGKQQTGNAGTKPEYNPTGHLENTGKAIAGLFSLLSGGNDTPPDNSQVPPPKKKKRRRNKDVFNKYKNFNYAE